jgi:tRNA 2-thiouridine synthesizing protein E
LEFAAAGAPAADRQSIHDEGEVGRVNPGAVFTMSTRTINNRAIDFDAEGFMTDSTQWDLGAAQILAAEEGIAPLTERHVAVLNYMRREFAAKGEAPSIRRLTKESGVSTKELYDLFPGGPAKKAARIAGIKKPHGCI